MRAWFMFLVLVAGCSGGPDGRTEVEFDTDGKRVTFSVEVADSLDEMTRGLMGRAALDANAGMLFIWSDAKPRSFHMLNTRIPLDLVSIRAGRVVGVQTMVPCPTQTGCRITTTPAADAALEINAGAADRAGIAPGALVASSALR